MLSLTRCVRIADVLSGVGLSQEIRRRIAAETQQMVRPPCLAVVLVGDRPDSLRYTRHKAKAAEACGIHFRLIKLPDTISQQRLHRELVAVNSDHGVDGVLLQLPLPPHLRARPALFHIHPGKDVDGLHPLNAGNLFLRDGNPLAEAGASSAAAAAVARRAGKGGTPPLLDDSIVVATTEGAFSSIARLSHEGTYFIPCTALAVRSLILSYLHRTEAFCDADAEAGLRRPPRELHAVVVNTSMVVGIPTVALLQKERGFTVTLCGRDNSLGAIRQLTRTADVLVTAYGQANVFDASFVKEGAIVVDVAINETAPAEAAAMPTRSATPQQVTRTLCGDVHVDSVKNIARAVTPVPGGVGPLTVAYLMQNTLKAARLRYDRRLLYNDLYRAFLRMYGGGRPTPGVGGASSSTGETAIAADGAAAVGADTPATVSHDDEEAEEDDDDIHDFTDNGSFDC